MDFLDVYLWFNKKTTDDYRGDLILYKNIRQYLNKSKKFDIKGYHYTMDDYELIFKFCPNRVYVRMYNRIIWEMNGEIKQNDLLSVKRNEWFHELFNIAFARAKSTTKIIPTLYEAENKSTLTR